MSAQGVIIFHGLLRGLALQPMLYIFISTLSARPYVYPSWP